MIDRKLKVFDLPVNVSDDVKNELSDTLQRMKAHVQTRGPNAQWSLDDVEIGCFLGRGKFGRVYLVRDVHAHLPFAMKVMHKSEIVKNSAEKQVLREIEIQSHLRHKNILTLFTYFDDSRFIFLILEYAHGGELYRHLQNSPNKRFEAEKAAKYLHQVVEALIYCHERRVIHRDIKPENILLDGDDNIKLSDFGWSVHAPNSARRTMCGTLDYLPPEMVKHQNYSRRVDNWCIGVLCYEFLTGSPPFETASTQTTYEKITSLNYTFPSYVTTEARDLIQKLLKIKPEERIAMEHILEHPWIKMNYICPN